MLLGNLALLFRLTASRNHILFTLMASAMTKEDDPSEFMEKVHRSLFPLVLQETRPSPGKQHKEAALTALEAAMSAASHGCNATEIQQRICDLAVSMLSLDDAGLVEVDKMNCRTGSLVTEEVPRAVRQSLDFLFSTFHESLTEGKTILSPVRDEVTEIIANMAEALSVEPSSLTFATPVVLQALCQARATSRDPGVWSTTRDGPAAVAKSVLKRLADGTFHLPACPITGLPYSAVPPVDGGSVCHAVQLHACGCCMSKCAADATLDAGACAVCLSPLPPGEQYRLSASLLRVAQAHRARILPPEAAAPRLLVEDVPFPVPLSARAEGSFHPGTLHGEPVAVLRLYVGSVESKQRACISHALVATNLAATLSPLHCPMRAVVWEPDQVSVAYAREPFQGDAATDVKAATPLTVADVIARSNSGCPAQQALDVVIDVAEAHTAAMAAAWSDGPPPALGALTPDRVLIRPDRRVQVADFRLLRRSCVPPAVARAVHDGVPHEQAPPAQSPHCERYVAPEALSPDGAGGAAADGAAAAVFSLGALLHFLVAGRHPPTAAELESIGRKAPWAGSTRALTASITCANLAANAPPRMDEIRVRMLDSQPAARPALAEVTTALSSELYAAAGADEGAERPGHGAAAAPGVAASVIPAWDRSPPEPTAPSKVFHLPERCDSAAPRTFSPASSAAMPPQLSLASELTGVSAPDERYVYRAPQAGVTAGVTTGVTAGVVSVVSAASADMPGSPLRHNGPVGHTSGSQGSAMSGSAGGHSAAAPGVTTASSWAAAEPLQSCDMSCTSAQMPGYYGLAAGGLAPSPFAPGAGEPAAEPAREPGAVDRSSSAGVGADAASQMSRASTERHDSGSPRGEAGTSARRTASRSAGMRRIASWFQRGQPSTLPQLVQLLSGDWRGCECDLKGRHFKMSCSRSGSFKASTLPPLQNPDAPLGWDVTIREQEINFQSPAFDARCIFDLTPYSGAHAGTCCVATEGTHLREGFFDLAVTGRLVFGPDCNGLTLSNMTIRDGTLICFGSTCRVHIEACALAGCSIIAAGGAMLTITRNCDFHKTRLAIFAHGPGTSVVIEDAGIRDCRQALCVAAGAAATLSRCVVSQAGVTGCEVRGRGSSLELCDCTITDAGSPPDYQWWIQGLWVHSGARATASRCALIRMTAGVFADGPGTELHLEEASCISNLACGALIGYGAMAALKDCEFFTVAGSPKQPTGVDVCGEGTRATLQGSRLRYNGAYGARVSDRGVLKCTRCQTQQNGIAGWDIEHGAEADLESCTSTGERAYAVARGGVCRTVLCRPDVMG